jgi:hypothetical protein
MTDGVAPGFGHSISSSFASQAKLCPFGSQPPSDVHQVSIHIYYFPTPRRSPSQRHKRRSQHNSDGRSLNLLRLPQFSKACMIDLEINKPSSWNGQALTGEWLVTLKVDGVRAIHHAGQGWLSRANKPLYNLPPYQGGPRDCEIYLGSFRNTIIATRTRLPKSDTPIILREHLYGLDQLDARLHFGTLIDPSADDIRLQLDRAQALGFEGLVLRQGDRWLKVKASETHDEAITGFVEGRGKHAGRLGIINTELGNVSSGFSDEERVELWAEAQAGTLIGQTVEVSFMEYSAVGKFRHPVFVRMRPDKIAA